MNVHLGVPYVIAIVSIVGGLDVPGGTNLDGNGAVHEERVAKEIATEGVSVEWYL